MRSPTAPQTTSLFEPRNVHADHWGESTSPISLNLQQRLSGKITSCASGPSIHQFYCYCKDVWLPRKRGWPWEEQPLIPRVSQYLASAGQDLTAANSPEGKPVWDSRDPRSTTRGTKSGDKPGPHSLGRLLTQALAATRK